MKENNVFSLLLWSQFIGCFIISISSFVLHEQWKFWFWNLEEKVAIQFSREKLTNGYDLWKFDQDLMIKRIPRWDWISLEYQSVHVPPRTIIDHFLWKDSWNSKSITEELFVCFSRFTSLVWCNRLLKIHRILISRFNKITFTCTC